MGCVTADTNHHPNQGIGGAILDTVSYPYRKLRDLVISYIGRERLEIIGQVVLSSYFFLANNNLWMASFAFGAYFPYIVEDVDRRIARVVTHTFLLTSLIAIPIIGIGNPAAIIWTTVWTASHLARLLINYSKKKEEDNTGIEYPIEITYTREIGPNGELVTSKTIYTVKMNGTIPVKPGQKPTIQTLTELVNAKCAPFITGDLSTNKKDENSEKPVVYENS